MAVVEFYTGQKVSGFEPDGRRIYRGFLTWELYVNDRFKQKLISLVVRWPQGSGFLR